MRSIVDPDGSFTSEDERDIWGYAMDYKGMMLTKKAHSHSLYASSIRMEFEAIKQALQWLSETNLPLLMVVFARLYDYTEQD